MPETVAPSAPQSTIYDAATDPRVAEHDASIGRSLDAFLKPAPSTPASNQPATPAAPESRHSTFLRLKARQAGLDPAEIETIDSNELKELLTDMRLMSAETRMLGTVSHDSATGSNGTGFSGEVPANLAAPANPATAPAAPPVPDPRIELAKGLKAVVDEDVANGIIAYIEGVLAPLSPRLAAIEGHVNEAVPFVRKQRAAIEDQQIDAGFADLGAGFERIIGKGGAGSIETTSGQFKCRIQVVKQLRANPPKDGNIRKATADITRAMYGHMADEVIEADDEVPPVQQRHNLRNPTNQRFTAADYQQAALSTPNGRASPPPAPGRERAINGVKEAQSRYDADGGDELNQGEDKFL
jgi:hypothetical protein